MYLIFFCFKWTVLLLFSLLSYCAYAQYTRAEPSSEGPTFSDPNIKAEVVFEGLDNPTSMVFLAPDDILVLQKNEGTVNRIIDGKMLEEPLLHVDVGQQVEWGMLGIAISNIPDIHMFFYTILRLTLPLILIVEIRRKVVGVVYNNKMTYWAIVSTDTN
jgi:hypothetical protein